MVSLKRGDFYILTKHELRTANVIWTEYFRGSANARAHAVKDWGSKIDWRISGASLTSSDLNGYQYSIKSIKCKD